MSNMGGNKKSSSPSTVKYWARAKAGGFSETHRNKRIAAHAKRMGLTKDGVAKATMPVKYKPVKAVTPLEHAVMKELVTEHRYMRDNIVLAYPKFVISNGVILDVISARR